MPDPLESFVDPALAARLEAGLAAELEAFAETAGAIHPEMGAESLHVAGGTALFLDAGSLVNQAAGLGFSGPVTSEDLDRLEAFYAWHRSRPVVVVSPLADPSLARLLGERGYGATSFENVLVRPLSGPLPTPSPGIEVHPVTPEERETYARVLADGFAAPGRPVSEAERRVSAVVAHLRDTTPLLASIEGKPAGTGELAYRAGMAWLTGDATLPRFRRRGVQTALQAVRLRMAAEAGLTLAVSETRPGSDSQRNMERAGFRVAYTRVHFAAPR